MDNNIQNTEIETVDKQDDVIVEETTTDIEVVEEKSSGIIETIVATAGFATAALLAIKVYKLAKVGTGKAKTFVKGGIAAVRKKAAEQEDAEEDIDYDLDDMVEVIDTEETEN